MMLTLAGAAAAGAWVLLGAGEAVVQPAANTPTLVSAAALRARPCFENMRVSPLFSDEIASDRDVGDDVRSPADKPVLEGRDPCFGQQGNRGQDGHGSKHAVRVERV